MAIRSNSNIKIKRTVIALAVTSALFTHNLIAEEQVETVTVTGQQLDTLDIQIDQDALEKSQASNLKDIFKDTAEVTVGGGSSISQKVYVRGLESTMLNVTIDGAKQSSSTFHHQGSISIEPELLKNVEVQAGAGNALNGPGALGGALSFTTKDPDDLLNADERFGALVKGNYDTNGYKTSLSLYGTLTDNWSAMATLVQTEADNYNDGDGNEIEYTDYNQQNGLIKLVGNFDNNQRLSFSYDNRIDDGDRTRKTNNVASVNNPAFYQEAYRQTGIVEYSINPENNQWLALETNAFYTETSINRDDTAWAALYGGGFYEGVIETYGLDIRNTNKFSEHSLTYGIDYHQDKSTYEDLNVSGYKKLVDTSDVYGIYLQAELQLAQAWLLSIGSRYDIYKTVDADEQEFESKGLSPNVSIQFTPLDNLQLQLSYAQAMRGVEVIETFVLESYQNAVDLEEERAESIEFSFNYQLNSLDLSAKMYHSTINDVIDYGQYGDDDYKTYDNRGELVTKGVTLGINYNWQALQTSVTYNHNTSELNGESLGGYYDYTLGTSTGDKINTNVNYQLSDSLEFGWSASFVTRLTDTAEYFDEKAGYGVHDVYGQWLPLNDDALKVTLSVSNFFDKTYRDQATFGVTDFGDAGDKAEGRNVSIAVAWAI